MSRIEVKKGLFGRWTVGYDCPKCSARLSSPLQDAGKLDECPDCKVQFAVPGIEERERISADKAAAEQEKMQRKEQERRYLEERNQKELERKRREQESRLRELERTQIEFRAKLTNDNEGRETTNLVPFVEKQHVEVLPPVTERPIRCPKCGSTQLTANKKGFGLGNAAIGGLILGPVGLLGGLIGGNKIMITCLNCAHSFGAGEGK